MPASPSHKKPALFALLIAINDYHPESGVSDLAGCLNDLRHMRRFLKKQYADLQPKIKVLTNEKATREGVIKAFRRHLVKKAKAGDTVFFYYAGHGSHTATAPEFEAFDGQKQDETFVCYDSRLPGNHDLADKEIAVLLSEIPEGVHTVFIADSCHSASVTRSSHLLEDPAASYNLAAKRYFKGSAAGRSLKSYLLDEDNYYIQQSDEIRIPRSRHLLMSACGRDEEAWETEDRRGLFTTTLLDVLESNPHLSYGEIYSRVKTRVYNTAQNQQPSFYPFEGFNPNTVFLRSDSRPNPLRHQVKKVGQEWRLDYGAIHGLQIPVPDLDKLIIGVFADHLNSTRQVAVCGVEQILLKETLLKDTDELDSEKTYFGEIQSFPAALMVHLEGEKKDLDSFQKIYQRLSAKFPFVQLLEEPEPTRYYLKIKTDSICIHLRETGELLHGIRGKDEKEINYVLEILTDIENWERIRQLNNPDSSLDRDQVEFMFSDESDLDCPVVYRENIVNLDYPGAGADKDSEGDPVAIYYSIKVRNRSKRPLYISLVQLGANFEIANHYKCEVFPAKGDWVTLDDQHGLAILQSAIHETTDIFKIIVSTEDFDDYKFNQEGIQLGKVISQPGDQKRAILKRKKRGKKADWFVHTLTVNTIRKQAIIGPREVRMEGISIAAHNTFCADLSFLSAGAGARNLHPANSLSAIFSGETASLIHWAPKGSRSLREDRSIIELNNIRNAETLKKNPLELKIDTSLSRGGQVIPVTLQNGFVIPVGQSKSEEDGSVLISISGIPEEIDLTKGATGSRSPGRALWFCLLKMGGMQESVFKFRKVIRREGKGVRTYLRQRDVDRAKKILLVTHGIIGNTKTMIPNLGFLLAEDHYDLLITFDYENLNTPIEDIARQLDQKLGDYGIGAGDGKIFHILAHSMGGLVSRYLIEHLHKGDNMVDRLFMFGTPNGGSAFGKIPEFRDRLVQLLTISLNFTKGWTGWVHALLDVTNKILIGSKQVTRTLAQMNPEHSFIKSLRKARSIHTKYTVIAGDITAYESLEDTRFKQFAEKVLLKIGDLVNGAPNDIAVKVEDIEEIPANIESEIIEICCHHLNYFDSENGLEVLREITK